MKLADIPVKFENNVNPAIDRYIGKLLRDVDRGIENYLRKTFEIDVDFDLGEALGRLIGDGLVAEDATGLLTVLQPVEAASHIDFKWDQFLDDLVGDDTSLGVEVDD